MPNWPHAPIHILQKSGIYMVTAGTYLKQHFFHTNDRLQFLHEQLLAKAISYGWQLHAWAVFSNHYHFVAQSPNDPSTLKEMLTSLHSKTAIQLNKIDSTPQRKVWYQYWDSRITIQTSYLARLNYVHKNAVKHGIVAQACEYPWCSASQFESQAEASHIKTVYSFDFNRVKVFDDF